MTSETLLQDTPQIKVALTTQLAAALLASHLTKPALCPRPDVPTRLNPAASTQVDCSCRAADTARLAQTRGATSQLAVPGAEQTLLLTTEFRVCYTAKANRYDWPWFTRGG